MKNWKKLLSIAALALTTAVFAGTAAEAEASGYERWDTVAQEERVPAGYGTSERKTDKPDPKAWKKIKGVCYNGSGEPIPGAITWGMDVSEWQGKINWAKVKKSGIDFAFVRISYGVGYMDKTYDYNMEQAELAGVPVGTYVYSLATNTKMALAEAKLAIEKMDGYKVSYPVVFDLEYSKMGDLTPTQVSKIALAFCNEVRKAGYYPMIYCNTNWYDHEINWKLLEGYDVWIARYGDTIQAPPHSDYAYTIWQSTDGDGGGLLNPTAGLVGGVPAGNNVDVDFGYVDYTKKIVPRRTAAPGYTPGTAPDLGSDGAPYEKEGWKEESGKTYYYENNAKVRGWKTIGGQAYYFDKSTGELWRSQLVTEDGKIRYVDEKGVRVKNRWVTWNKKTYYMCSTGTAYNGMRTIDGKTYYFHTSQRYMLKNKRVVTRAGDIYYFGSDGVRYENGFYTVKLSGEKKTFYFHKDGKAHKGWLNYNGKKYYFYNGTAAASGTRAENITLTSSNKVVSVFDKNGVCIRQYKKKG